MKNPSLYKNLTTNQIKMAIFLIGFLLIAAPGIVEAKLITVGTTSDTVNFGNNVGIGTTAPNNKLHVVSGDLSSVSWGSAIYSDATISSGSSLHYSGIYSKFNINATTAAAGNYVDGAIQAQVVKNGDYAGATTAVNYSSFGSFGNGSTPTLYMYKSRAGFESGTTGSITNLYHFFANAPYGTGTITNATGLYIEKQKQTGVTNAYGIYQVDSADTNYFAGNVGIGALPSNKLDVSGTFRNTLATTHSLLGGAGNAVVMTDNSGSLFSMSTATFASSAANVSTLYHIKPWFVPAAGQTVSSSGTTVTMLNPVSNFQFYSSMIGSRLTINGESRVITAYTSTSVVTVDSAYSTNYSAVSNTLWGVYSRAVSIAADGSISTYSEVGSMAIQKRSGDTNVYIPALLDKYNKYYWPSDVLYLNKDFPIKWSAGTSYSGTNDVGLRRSSTAGVLEIYDGTGTTPGTAADYRDLNLRSLNPAGGNIGIGTTTAPMNKLVVVTDQSGGGVIKVQNTNIASWSSFEMFDYAGVHKASFGYANPNAPTVAGLAHFSTSDDTPFIIAIHDLEKMRVTTNGYIGIGETNPQQKFTITGTSTASTLQTNISAYANSGLRINGIGAYSQDAITYQASDGGGAAIAFRRGGGYDTYLDFYTNTASVAGGITQAMTIDNNGNVGIGNTSPDFLLDVNGGINIATGTSLTYGGVNLLRAITARDNYFLGSGAGNFTMTGTSNEAFGSGALNANTSGSWNVAIGGSTLVNNTTGFGNTAINDAALWNNSTGEENTAVGDDAMATNTTGSRNSGYGGAVLLDLISGSNNTAIGYNSGRGLTTGGANTIIGANITGLAANLSNNIIIADGDGNQRINVNGSGNVGIGSTAPNQILHILDKTSNYATINIEGKTDTADAGAAILFNEGNGTTQWNGGLYGFKVAYDGGNNYLYFEGFGNGTSAGKHLSILRSGNVGIGITSPAAKLDVAGTTKLGTAGTAFTAMGTCTIAASVITTTKVTKTCTGIPASTAVAVSCTGSAAFSGTSTIYCRPTGTADQLACNTIATNTTSMSYTCMWMQP